MTGPSHEGTKGLANKEKRSRGDRCEIFFFFSAGGRKQILANAEDGAQLPLSAGKGRDNWPEQRNTPFFGGGNSLLFSPLDIFFPGVMDPERGNLDSLLEKKLGFCLVCS